MSQMRRVVAILVCAASLFPALAGAQGTSPQAQAQGRRGWYKMVAGTLSASVGLGLFAAGNTQDPFTGDKSTGQMAAGLALTGAGAWLMWGGWRDIQDSRKSPSITIGVNRRGASVAYRKSW